VPFVKGQSGNPAGRKPGERRIIENLAIEARKHSHVALKTLVDICKKGESHTVRVAAATAILDRGFGRPSQSVELAGELTMTHQGELFGDIDIASQRALQVALRTIEHREALMIEHDPQVEEFSEAAR
jgi:hypothetical protein